MERWRIGVLFLAALLLAIPPATRAQEADDEGEGSEDAAEAEAETEGKHVPGDKEATSAEPADEETAEEMEEAAREAMDEAQQMLERARSRKESTGESDEDEAAPARGVHTHWPEEVLGEEAPAAPAEDAAGFEEVEPVEVPAETKKERRARIRKERAEKRARLREEKKARKIEIREERRQRKAQIREERLRAREAARERKRLAASESTRPRFYINGMLVGAILTEDDQNRITSRDRESLEGVGSIFRAGGVIRDHHLIGVRLQTFLHLTRSILDHEGGNDQLGSVFQFYAGPEYRYITSFGLYGGVSLGVSFLSVDDDLDSDEGRYRGGYWRDGYYYDDELSDDRSVSSLGLIGVLGYELRFSRWFMMNFEMFGGLFHGLDDEDFTMNSATFGLAVGLGF